MKKTLFLFAFALLSFWVSAKAHEGNSSVSNLSPSTIFDPGSYSCVSPRNNLGTMLKNIGFQQQSLKEEKGGFQVSDPGAGIDKSYPSYVKTFTKNGYTVRYRYAIYADDTRKDNVCFDWVEIKFPSQSAMNEFIDSLKASIKRKGNKIFTDPEYPGEYFIGDDVSDLKDGITWSYDLYWIEGNTVTFQETKGMNPHEYFED